ncbi:MAG: SRPBCC domain-containing protein [Rhodospirillaceae bacterium]|nr:SRPBCC domain-containing protein [Rhodospirillaceae bacterium]
MIETDPHVVREFAVPPIRKELTVKIDQVRAFAAFTAEIDNWWPHKSHSVFEEGSAGNGIEPRLAGHFYETSNDGARAVIGIVAVWEPPARLTFTWHPGRSIETAQIVDLRFTVTGAGTRLALTHAGWENLGEEGAARRQMYDGGWDHVLLHCFGTYADKLASTG